MGASKRKTANSAASKPATTSPRKTKVTSGELLSEYRQKRDFSKTAEPSGKKRPAKTALKRVPALRFVIQKHAASRLHFDLRLEIDGVIKSWAVPKGPSADPSLKRLAMQVEDHPIDYNAFEGTIPKGEYGGGTVMLWDTGTYHPDTTIKPPTDQSLESDEDIARDGYQRGDFKVVFKGKRIKGSYALVRTNGRFGGSSSKPSWLLIKHRDNFAIDSTEETDLTDAFTSSVTTGRSMDKIAADG